MPGIDQRKPNFQPSARTEPRAANEPVIRQTSASSLAAKKILQANSEKNIEKKLEENQINNNLSVTKFDQEQKNKELKQQRATQSDGFQKAESQLATKPNTSLSQYAAEIKEKKERQQATQSLAQNIHNSQLGLVKAKVNNPQAKTSAEEIQTSAFVAQANVDAVDQDNLSKEEKQAYKLLEEIFSRGAEKGKAFVSFAKREINKGRLAEIMDLIEGYHKTLKGDSKTASEMIEIGQEKLTTVKDMVSASNTEELHLLNQKIIARPDSPVGFKLDQKYLRNLAGSERVAPPSFNKATKPSKVEEVIRFISTINNTALKAPWDKLA